MPNVRPLNASKYKISKHRFLYVYHFCLQYNEWVDELKYKIDTVSSAKLTGMPKNGAPGEPTEDLALRRVELQKNIKLVEQTCYEACAEIYKWLLKAVTNEGIGYTYLKECMCIPCGKKMYYDRRRKFYWLMAQKI